MIATISDPGVGACTPKMVETYEMTIPPRPVVEAENRLEQFNGDRARIVSDVERRIVDDYVRAAAAGGDASLEYVINEVAFSEMRRYEKTKGRASQKKFQRWRELANRLNRMSEQEKRERLSKLVHEYALDIVGNFNPRVYRFATDLLPPALSFLFSPIHGLREGLAALSEFAGQVEVEGPLDTIRAVCEQGTMVVTPTHSSNMDSIAIGFGLNRSHLPPCTYGAGKNLFSNPLISYFMHNLGAYRVDRRLRFPLYKNVLKEYSTVLLEGGYHSLFFPGGTRCRSNHVEQKLKLGLLGTTVKAYENNVRAGQPYRRLYVLPVTINYRLVLEAETLIDDYLADKGKSRYIIEDDEFSRVGRILEFARKMFRHEGAVVLRFGTPLDPFGNEVRADGQSYDRRGRLVDPAGYVRDGEGNVVADDQRNAQYTRRLGTVVAAAFRSNTVFLTTSIVARAAYDAIAAKAGSRDIYQLLRVSPAKLRVLTSEVALRVDRLRQQLAEQPSAGVLHHRAVGMTAEEIIDDALRALGIYHTRPVVSRVGDELEVGSMKLLYYYQNRTAHLADQA